MLSKYIVSIITPNYNSSKYISKTITSILNQTYEYWELIIIDDCSMDNSVEIIKSNFCYDPRIKLVELPKNIGVAKARNVGINEAKGRYIAFLDSDDLWYPDKLEKQINFMTKNNVELSYTGYEKIDENGVAFQQMRVPLKLSYSDLLKTCYIGCLTAMYDTQHLGKIYMPTNTKREDYATWLNILKIVDCAFAVPEVLAKYRVYRNQSSARKTSMAKENWYLYRHIEQLGSIKSIYYFSHYALNGLLRTKFPKLSEKIDLLRRY